VTSTERPRPRAVLLGVQLPGVSDAQLESSLGELRRLAKTLGIDVVGRVTQKRPRLAPGAVVGEGKLKELAEFTGGSGVVPVGPPRTKRRAAQDRGPSEDEAEGAAAEDAEPRAGETDEAGPEGAGTRAEGAPARADLVLVNHELTPSQARNLERATNARVLDRTAVILAIFQHHARSREARLQVEIARLSYDAPRLRETSGGQDRQAGHVGGRGAGESALELDRRKVRDRIAELRAELEQIEREARTRRQRRGGLQTVALVGYTNAGKSSWMRALTGSGVLVEDKLFATLDTTVRALQPEVVPRILVSDTVGFIDQLPHALVASFRSTLDEARDCELLIHLVDASDPGFPNQIRVTREVLDTIDATESPRLMVLNKIDRVEAAARERLAEEWPGALQLSVRDPADVAGLRERIVAFFERDMVEAELVVPYAKQRVVAEAHAGARVLAESHDERGTRLRVRAKPETLERLRAALRGA
jgi:GTP-binding protein HflX